MILITGGAGYIGSHTVHFLITRGYKPSEIVVFDNLEHGHCEHLPKGVLFIKGDLLDRSEIGQAFKAYPIESVIHFAAYAYVGESMANPYKYFQNNILGGLNLLEAMKDYGCRQVVFSSTCAVFGIPLKLPIDESEPIKPINPYGESKATFESILKWYDEIYGIRYVSLRYFNAAGADFGIGEWHEPETHLIPLTLKAVLDKDYTLSVFGTDYDTPDGTCIRDYVHVTDLADAHLKALDYLKAGSRSEVFNLGSQRGISVKEIISIVEDITGNKVIYKTSGRRVGDPPVLVASSAKAGSVLCWSAKRDIRDIIKSAYSWHCNR
jgi:UDP-glucose 4-epimerase